jgi:hypothetical protein
MRVPALLAINPELQRNLWLELSPTRLIAMPIALGVLLGGVVEITSRETAGSVTLVVLGALLLFWGSRLAADGFGEEVASGTWDVQRLSATGAWSMTLGKYAGGTSYAWYGALLAAPFLVVLNPAKGAGLLVGCLLAGLIAQGVALLTVVVLYRFGTGARRGHTTIAQLFGFAIGLQAMLQFDRLLAQPSPQSYHWFGHDWPPLPFFAAQEIGLVVWLAIAVMRTIRREFGQADGPLGWIVFNFYCAVLGIGVVLDTLADDMPPVAAALAVTAVVSAVLTYAGLLVTPTAPTALKRLAVAWRRHDGREIWRNLPIWAPSALVLTVASAALLGDLGFRGTDRIAPWLVLAGLGFVFRDIAIVHLVRLTWKQRTFLALLILFGLLYGILPALTEGRGSGLLHQLFLPFPADWSARAGPAFGPGAILPWLEAVVVVALLVRRLRPAGPPG